MFDDPVAFDRECETLLFQFGTLGETDRHEWAWGWSQNEIDSLLQYGGRQALFLTGWLQRYRDREVSPGYELRALLESALEPVGSEEMIVEDIESHTTQPPRYPTPILPLQAATGGHYGVTVVGGDEGVGKSSVCAGTAILSALDGWRVFYVNAELDRERLGFYARRLRLHRRLPKEVLDRVSFLNFGMGSTLDDVLRNASVRIEPHDRRVLFILDSINTILDKEPDHRMHYFDRLRRWAMWAMEARRISEGGLSFLITSELNQRKETSGVKLKYLADMVVVVKKTSTKNYCDVEVTKGRYSGPEKFGALQLNYRTGEFEGEAKL